MSGAFCIFWLQNNFWRLNSDWLLGYEGLWFEWAWFIRRLVPIIVLFSFILIMMNLNTYGNKVVNLLWFCRSISPVQICMDTCSKHLFICHRPTHLENISHLCEWTPGLNCQWSLLYMNLMDKSFVWQFSLAMNSSAHSLLGFLLLQLAFIFVHMDN